MTPSPRFDVLLGHPADSTERDWVGTVTEMAHVDSPVRMKSMRQHRLSKGLVLTTVDVSLQVLGFPHVEPMASRRVVLPWAPSVLILADQTPT
jgi:hypothetical protein